MAETRAGKTAVVSSTLITGMMTIATLLLFIFNSAGMMKPKLFVVLTIFSIAALAGSTVASAFGWNRMRRALDKPSGDSPTVNDFVPPRLTQPEMQELPPMTERPASVTEGTTNLLDEDIVRRPELEKVPLKGRNTNELD